MFDFTIRTGRVVDGVWYTDDEFDQRLGQYASRDSGPGQQHIEEAMEAAGFLPEGLGSEAKLPKAKAKPRVKASASLGQSAQGGVREVPSAGVSAQVGKVEEKGATAGPSTASDSESSNETIPGVPEPSTSSGIRRRKVRGSKKGISSGMCACLYTCACAVAQAEQRGGPTTAGYSSLSSHTEFDFYLNEYLEPFGLRDRARNCSSMPGPNLETCHICGEVGHYARECPERRGRQVRCYECKQMGHIARDCPLRSRRSVLDSGPLSRGHGPAPAPWRQPVAEPTQRTAHQVQRRVRPLPGASVTDTGSGATGSGAAASGSGSCPWPHAAASGSARPLPGANVPSGDSSSGEGSSVSYNTLVDNDQYLSLIHN